MSGRKRRDYGGNPLEYFRKHHGDGKITRGQLSEEDHGLYGALRRAGQLDEAIPERLTRNFGGNPLAWFKSKFGKKEMTRTQLSKKDPSLYTALKREKQLDEAIPERITTDYGGNPLAYFREHYGDRKDITRVQLSKERGGLYHALIVAEQLDKAIPEKQHREYSGNPLAYFKRHHGDGKITRSQLAKRDSGLYSALWKTGKLDEAIPEKNVRKYREKYESPLECYRDKFGDRKMTREELYREDSGLYGSLRYWGQMDEAIPERKVSRNFNGNPLAYFREHYGDGKMTRGKLLREGKGLYQALRKRGQLDEAIPKGISEKEKLEVMLRRMTG